MKIIDGKKIRDEIQASLKREFFNLEHKPILSIIYVGANPVIDKFIGLKKRFGENVGVDVVVNKIQKDISQTDLENSIKKSLKQSDAMVVQLPLPPHIDMEKIINLVPKEKDIDMLSKEAFESFIQKETKRMPPVVGSVVEVLKRNNLDIKNKKIVIVGKGRLVGKPIFLWLLSNGVSAKILDENDDLKKHTKDADMIISGAGDPYIIKPSMIKDGVVLVDVGTSESSGVVKGDIDPECAKKASLYSGVPGGIGPITIAKLFQNILLK